MSTYATIGSINPLSGTGTSIVFTTNVIVNVGDLVIIRYVNNSPARPAGIVCTDNTGGSTNTFAIAIDGGNAVTSYCCIFWCVATSSIASGGTITVSTTSSFTFRGIDGIKCTNPLSSTPLDAGPTKFLSGSSTTPNSGTVAAPATSDWVGVCVIDYNTTSITQQAGWTEDNDNSAIGMETQTIIGTNTTPMNGAGTAPTSAGWSCSAAVFMLGVSSSTPGSRTAIPFTQGAGGGAFGGGGPH